MLCTAGAVIAIAFIHNLLRRHPSCNVLVNKPIRPETAGTAAAAAPSEPTAALSASGTPRDPAAQNGIPDAMTNGHSHDSSDASSSQLDPDSSDGDAPDTATDQKRHLNGLEAQASAGAAVDGSSAGIGEDVFDEHEADPAKCRAIESSLWELDSLRHHYYHTVRPAVQPVVINCCL